jgi:hypothetical protein
METVVYSRFVFDSPYLNAFIEHYKNLGFKTIILLFHESYLNDIKYKKYVDKDCISNEISIMMKNKIYEKKFLKKEHITDDSIIIHPVNNYKDSLIKKFSKIIPDSADWVLNIDSDEYLLINNKFKSIQDLINEALLNVPSLYCIEFKWIWITNCIQSKNIPLNSLIKKYHCYEHMKIKTDLIFNIKTLQRFKKGMKFTAHCVSGNIINKNRYVISNYCQANKHPDKNIKVNDDTLGILLHIRLRSFYNMIFKCLNVFQKSVPSKNAAVVDNKLLTYFTNVKNNGKSIEKIFIELYNLDILKYEKKHENNVISKKYMILTNFNNCVLDSKELFAHNENNFYECWIKKYVKNIFPDDKEIKDIANNIKIINKKLQELNEIKSDRSLNIFVA